MVFAHRTLDPLPHSDLSDDTWSVIEPLVCGVPRGPGRPARDHRMVVNGILWVLDTGAPWRHVPMHYGPWQTLYGRYVRWRDDGTWQRLESVLGVVRPSRVVTAARAITVLAFLVLVVFMPQPARAERLGHGQLQAMHMPVRGGRRRVRRQHGQLDRIGAPTQAHAA